MVRPEFTFAHLGINHKSAIEAADAAEIFSGLFGFSEKNGNSSIFSGSRIELTKSKFPGNRGHIGIGTSNVSSSVKWLAGEGIRTIDGTEKYKDGRLVAVYLDLTISGFAIHLVLK